MIQNFDILLWTACIQYSMRHSKIYHAVGCLFVLWANLLAVMPLICHLEVTQLGPEVVHRPTQGQLIATVGNCILLTNLDLYQFILVDVTSSYWYSASDQEATNGFSNVTQKKMEGPASFKEEILQFPWISILHNCLGFPLRILLGVSTQSRGVTEFATR